MAKILHIVPYYNLFPPQNGGSLRCFHLLSALAKEHEVHLLSYQTVETYNDKLSSISGNVKAFCVTDFSAPKSLFSAFPKKLKQAILYRYLTHSIQGPAEATVLNFYPAVGQLCKKYNYDLVLFEHLQSMMLSKFVKKISPHSKMILDAHNVDHILVEKELRAKNHPKKSFKVVQKIKSIESSLENRIDGFLACSSNDLNILQELNHNSLQSFLIPNGVDTDFKPYQKEKKASPTLIFCGDLRTVANKDGLLWFYFEVFSLLQQSLPDIKLTVVGKGSDHPDFKELKQNERIFFTGMVESVVPFYYDNFIAIAPLRVGSGTRLKILEAMSLGNPVVATSLGAEGVNYPTSSISLANNKNTFAEKIIELLENTDLAERRREEARKFVENQYSWKTIGENLNLSLQQLL